jgi:3-oxoacyl-[acyl-carrier-protein] synthase-3
MRAVITAIGHFAPEHKLTNADLEKMVDTNDEWITTRTGIKERRILEKDKGVSHMAVQASKMALTQRGVSPDELDLIILATVSPDMLVPSAAALVQRELNAGNCWGFDLNGGCSGFIYALATGSQFIETGRHQKVLVIGADKMSSIIDYEDRNTCVIFGDGAGAVLLEPAQTGDDPGIQDFILRLNGEGAKYLCMAGGGSLHPASRETVEKKMHYVYQDGRTVYKHAVTGMSDVSEKILERNKLKPEDVGFLIPHQANIRIIDAVSNKLKLTADQVIVNIENYGNTTAATIPLAMSEAHQRGLLKKGDWLLLSAFGAGFTWGSLLMRWEIKQT